MDNINTILNRVEIENDITCCLNDTTPNKKNGFYIYGSPGSGKTQFIINILNKLNYDVIKYDAGDIRNKNLIDAITNNNISNRNVLDLLYKRQKKIAIVMDEIDGMTNGDKGGITSLIKIMRQKKTKKQKLEEKTSNPIICIGNYMIDKKIKELLKVCNSFELKTPTSQQTLILLNNILPNNVSYNLNINHYIQGDLRKLFLLVDIISKNDNYIDNNKLIELFCKKSYNEDTKKITNLLLNQSHNISEHNKILNETDRTIVALLWHENVIDIFDKFDINTTIPIYSQILNNICFADYIDRITFQNQIWLFNEMSSLIKTFYTNKILHDNFPNHNHTFNEIRFTKVLTKYSTEYNNLIFIYNLTQQLELDKKDLFAMFQELRLYVNNIEDNSILQHLESFFINYNLSKLDIKRIYRFLDKNSKKDIEVDIESPENK